MPVTASSVAEATSEASEASVEESSGAGVDRVEVARAVDVLRRDGVGVRAVADAAAVVAKLAQGAAVVVAVNLKEKVVNEPYSNKT